MTKPFHKETLYDKALSQSHLYIPTNPMGILYEQNYNAQAENVREDFIPENLPTVQHVQINFGLKRRSLTKEQTASAMKLAVAEAAFAKRMAESAAKCRSEVASPVGVGLLVMAVRPAWRCCRPLLVALRFVWIARGTAAEVAATGCWKRCASPKHVRC